MVQANSQVDGPEAKRRKVRKGTQSCWACRRRKVHCNFTANTDAICENCRRRGTACIRQEHPDEPMLSAGSIQIETRLGRIEELIGHLLENAVITNVSNSPTRRLSSGLVCLSRCQALTAILF